MYNNQTEDSNSLLGVIMFTSMCLNLHEFQNSSGKSSRRAKKEFISEESPKI